VRWDEERYVRLYKRDTADWLALSYDAQALFVLLLRKVDFSGRLELGRHGLKAIAMVLQQVALWESRLEPAVRELLTDGCVRLEGDALLIPNFEAAQTAKMSGKLRTSKWRERKDLDEAVEDSETPRHGPVTVGDDVRRAVTPAFIQPLTSQKDQKNPLTPLQKPKGDAGTVLDLKADERPPSAPVNGNGAALPNGTLSLPRPEQPRLRKRKRVETLAQATKFELEHVVNERSTLMVKALETQGMTEGEALAYANTRWPTGPPNERVVALAFEAYAMRAGAAPGGTS
jgi:hypothetical protein